MMAEGHPSELDLLALAEGELPGDRRNALMQHIDACPICARAVGEVEAGRAALRAAPAVEAPRQLRRRVSADLDAHEPPRRVYVSPMRLVALLAPLTVVLALVAAVASIDFGGDDSSGGGGRESAQADEGAGGGDTLDQELDAPTLAEEGMAVASVAGPPRQVAAFLKSRGLDARVVGRRVVVRASDPDAVARELAARPGGPIQVVVESP